MKLQLSVIVPTYNRKTSLHNLLSRLVAQSLDKSSYEIIVIDDGSRDGTREMVAQFQAGTLHKIRYYRQENSGAGAARNLGIRKAQSPVVLLIDDDMLPDEKHLETHLSVHAKHPEIQVAVLGNRVTPADTIDLLRKDENKGKSKHSIRTRDGEVIISYKDLVTADLSLKKEFASAAGLFNPHLSVVEDMDLAWRLRDLGLKLIYCPDAIAIHTGPLDTIEKVILDGRRYGRGFANHYGEIRLYRDEIWALGGRFNGGWNHFRLHPYSYLKDALRRWAINDLTIRPVLKLSYQVYAINSRSPFLRFLCREIWAYYYRHEFKETRKRLAPSPSGRTVEQNS